MRDRGYRFGDHTADLDCELWAPTLPDLLAEAARALTAAITAVDALEPATVQRVRVEATAPDELLLAWLEELHFLFETTDFLACHADIESVEESEGKLRLEASLTGEPFTPERHRLATLIKGVTYHDLSVEQTPTGWHAYVLFDI